MHVQKTQNWSESWFFVIFQNQSWFFVIFQNQNGSIRLFLGEERHATEPRARAIPVRQSQPVPSVGFYIIFLRGSPSDRTQRHNSALVTNYGTPL